jgi:hypothetical protein
MKVYVYRNLHRGGYSILDPKTKRVIAHMVSVALKNVTFKVRPGGRDRARLSGHKNVHAFVIGELVESLPEKPLVKVSYDPRVHDGFVQSVSKQRVVIADMCLMDTTGCYITE